MKFKLNLAIVILLLSSCSITKMRYSRGFNTNFELSLKKDKTEVQELKANKAVKKQHKTATAVALTETQAPANTTTAEGIANNETITADVVTTVKKTGQPKLARALLKPLQAVKTKQITGQEEVGPMERNVKWGAILFYGGILLGLVFAYAFLFTMAGFVLAIIGKTNIKRSNYAYRGEGLANSIIILYIIAIIVSLLYLMIFLWWLTIL